MASVTANIAKGRTVEFYHRVNSNDPANSALIMGVLVAGGASLADLQDADTLAAVLALSTEAAVAGYGRKTLTDVDLSNWAPDDTSNRVLLFLPQQTFNPNTGETWNIVFVAYDSDTTAGTDTDIIPITFHEMRIEGTTVPTVTGSPIVVNFSNGWVQEI